MLEAVISKISGAFCDTLPIHNAGLSLEHNPHKNVYASVKEYADKPGFEDLWVSAIDMQKAIETDEMWCLTWFPESPIGSCTIFGATLQSVMVAMYESEVLRLADEDAAKPKLITKPELIVSQPKGKLIV